MNPWLKEIDNQIGIRKWWVGLLWQFGAKKNTLRKASGLSDLQIHVIVERLKMKRPYGGEKSLWIWVVKRNRERNNSICYLCSKPILFGQKNEVDHDIPVTRLGFSVPENLHDTHYECNQAKGTMTADEYLGKTQRPFVANKYAGSCLKCKRVVYPGEGKIGKLQEKWVVQHIAC